MKPYIGVTGITDREQIRPLFSVVPPNAPRKLMVGVLASWKSVKGIPLSAYWQQQTPPLEQIKDIFIRDQRAINLVHYSSDINTEAELFEHLSIIAYKAASEAAPFLDGFQLNMTMPNLAALRRYKQHIPWHQFVLQINQRWLDKVDDDLIRLTHSLEPYIEQGLADAILFDLSSGRGQPINLVQAYRVLTMLTIQSWPCILGIAGGLGPDRLEVVRDLAEDFPDLSIDAQSNLRSPHNQLDIEATKRYIQQALTIFGMVTL